MSMKRGCRLLLAAFSLTIVFLGSSRAADTRMDQLNEREKQLLQKLEAVQQRERDIQSHLEDVRKRKQYLSNRQGVRKPGALDVTPNATPAATPGASPAHTP